MTYTKKPKIKTAAQIKDEVLADPKKANVRYVPCEQESDFLYDRETFLQRVWNPENREELGISNQKELLEDLDCEIKIINDRINDLMNYIDEYK